jgi:ankyrin repeat protein
MKQVPDWKTLRREYLKRKRNSLVRIGLPWIITCSIVPIAAGALTEPRSARRQINQDLIAAVRHQDQQAVTSLLQQGADVNLIDTNVLDANGKPIPKRSMTLTLLMEAITVGATVNTALIQMLLDHGANPNARGIFRDEMASPATVAMGLADVATVHLLLEHGANPNLMVSQNRPIGGTEFRTIRMPLFDYPLTYMRPRFSNVDRIALLSDMLAHGAQINRRDSDGNTALLWVTQSGVWHVVPLLLAHHADVNARNRYGGTALFYSVSDLPTLRLLLSHGAKVNFRNWEGKTALGEAANYPMPETVETDMAAIHLFLSYGADVDARDRDGETALSRLMDRTQTLETRQVIAVLKQAGARELPANRRRIVHPVHLVM